MAQRLTPIIGLAVAAALALAAVFGVVGLTPAYAGVETPDARGLTETDFIAQAGVTEFSGTSTKMDSSGIAPAVVVATAPDNIRVVVGQTATVDLNAMFDATGTGAPTINYYVLEALPEGTAISAVTLTGPARTDPTVVSIAAITGATDAAAADDDRVSIQESANTAAQRKVVITAVATGKATFRAFAESSATTDAFVAFEVLVVPPAPFITPSSLNPGARARYDVEFNATTNLEANSSEISIDMVDFNLPGTIDRSQVSIKGDAIYVTETNARATLPGATVEDTDPVTAENQPGYQVGFQAPAAATVSGDELTLTIPDMNPETEGVTEGIQQGDRVTILIQQGAGITNPTEGGSYDEIEISNNVDDMVIKVDTDNLTASLNVIAVPFLVELSEEDGGRGTTVTATGKGFKNGTSLGFFLDLPRQHIVQTGNSENGKPASNDNGVDDDGDTMVDETGESDSRAQDFVLSGATGGVGNDVYNGRFDAGEVKLCDVASVGGNDVGSCDFTVNNPPFSPGPNYVNAVDGRSNYGSTQIDDDQKFNLDPSITVTPNGGNPGETILVQGFDFPYPGQVTRVRLARQDRAADGSSNSAGLAGDITGNSAVGTNGDLNFRLVIPNWAVEGVQDLQVTASGSSDNVNVTIGGPQITVTPTTVLPNQRISLVGTGFTPNTRIAGGTGGLNPSITIGGYTIPVANINEGDPVSVDNGGKWSTSLDVPLRSVTTRDGEREIRVTDSGGRTGNVSVTIPARVVTIDPASGRIGTTATVRGENFPSKNDNGVSFNISIAYDAGAQGRATTVSTVSDASGRFEASIRIPTSATIPSTNTVRVSFEDEIDIPVTTTVTHEVPEGSITLSANSGVSGSRITLRGEGFKTFVPVRSVKVGGIDVLPSPAPSTNALGMTEFEILVPGLDSGIQTIEVEVSDTTASIGFTVTTGAEPGAETAVAEGIANLGENFIRAFNFNNDTKSWTFYAPEAGDASTMEYFIAGNSYWILVGQTQEVILNRQTRNLTCVNGNCWNLIVW